ncbi:trypco2 family protein [Streptomyces sp. YU58]|uniref:trypco2 family protein n=1 Tax=Streptomyces sp. SX92 TaxID=3158972 RepID=UPI0027B8A85F|nr:trypco2 family protein [Streptomyces coralus]WLW55372.1 trypco2 family protein [Streptomyces coralus]
MTDHRIELADAVQAVRDELVTAAARSSGQDVAFEVGDIQLEFSVELRKEVKGGVKVKAWVVEAGAEGGGGSTRTHRVAVTLKALDARTGEPWKVRNDNMGSVARFGRQGRGSEER